jgi:DNA-binding transcriptional MocR family regulator
MHDALGYLPRSVAIDSPGPWSDEDATFICPVPGCDRHFTLLKKIEIDMVTAPMRNDSPDIVAVVGLAETDSSVKGMWPLVPTYSNPTGFVRSQEVAVRLAWMQAAAHDFRTSWDNAYFLHHLTKEETPTLDILSLARAAGNPHRVRMFRSTSKQLASYQPCLGSTLLPPSRQAPHHGSPLGTGRSPPHR